MPQLALKSVLTLQYLDSHLQVSPLCCLALHLQTCIPQCFHKLSITYQCFSESFISPLFVTYLSIQSFTTGKQTNKDNNPPFSIFYPLKQVLIQ